MSATRRDVLMLYRRIVRESRRLEPDARQYYLRFARSGFTGHSDETDPERIQEIIARVEKDMDWILRKYTGSGLATTEDSSSEQPPRGARAPVSALSTVRMPRCSSSLKRIPEVHVQTDLMGEPKVASGEMNMHHHSSPFLHARMYAGAGRNLDSQHKAIVATTVGLVFIASDGGYEIKLQKYT